MRTLLAALLALFLPAASAGAQTPFAPTQGLNSKNQQATGTGAAATVTLTASARTRGLLSSLDAACGAGSAAISVKDGATTIWSNAGNTVGTTTLSKSWNPPLSSTLGQNLVISLASCGGANVGTLEVEGEVR